MIVGGPSPWHFLLDAKGRARRDENVVADGPRCEAGHRAADSRERDACLGGGVESTFQERPKYGEAQVGAS